MQQYPQIQHLASVATRCAKQAADQLESLHSLPHPELRTPLKQLYRNFFGWMLIRASLEDQASGPSPTEDEEVYLDRIAKEFGESSADAIFRPYIGTIVARPHDSMFRFSATAVISRAIADLIYQTPFQPELADAAGYCALQQLGALREGLEASHS